MKNEIRIALTAFLLITVMVPGVLASMFDVNYTPPPSAPSKSSAPSVNDRSGASMPDQDAGSLIGKIFVALVLTAGIAYFLMRRYKKGKLVEQNSGTIDEVKAKLKRLDSTYSSLRSLLYTVSKDNSSSDWVELRKKFKKINMNELWDNLSKAERLHEQGRSKSSETSELLNAIETRLTEYSGYCDEIESKLDEEIAAKDSPELLKKVAELITETEETIKEKNISSDLADNFADLKEEFTAIEKEAKSSDASWKEIYSSLVQMEESLKEIQAGAESEIAEDKSILLLESMPTLIAQTKEIVEKKNVSSETVGNFADAEEIFHATEEEAASEDADWIKIFSDLKALEVVLIEIQTSAAAEIATATKTN